MSLFKTIIPVDLGAIKKLLPKDSSIDSVKFDPATNSVELHWHARYVMTPHTFATEWPVELLEAQELPPTAKFTGIKSATELSEYVDQLVERGTSIAAHIRRKKARTVQSVRNRVDNPVETADKQP